MALPTEANYKLEVDKIAAALTIMWNDDVVSNPHHPLRQLMRQLKMDDEGVVTTNEAYITSAYAGNYPTDPENLETKKFKLP